MSEFESDEPVPMTPGDRWFHWLATLVALTVFVLAPLGIWFARSFFGWEPPSLILKALEYLEKSG
jgi:hypothetical protein